MQAMQQEQAKIQQQPNKIYMVVAKLAKSRAKDVMVRKQQFLLWIGMLHWVLMNIYDVYRGKKEGLGRS